MSTVPWWAFLSSGAGPVLLIGGWLAATALQPAGYDPVAQTISSLAADDATDRWVMSTVMIAVGVCYIATARGLTNVRAAGRIAMVFGGASTVLLAFSPEPAGGGISLQHTVATGIAFTAMAIWPCLAVERDSAAPWALRPTVSTLFTATVAVSAAWFLFELHDHGAAGLAERVVTSLQALWPLIVVTSLRRTSLRHTAHDRRLVTVVTRRQ
jgi:hypothetical membrane protein